MKKVTLFIAAFLIMLLPCFTASAYPSSGSITVVMINKANKQPLGNEKVIAVKVADCSYTESDISFSLKPDYTAGIDLYKPEAAQKLYSEIKEKEISGKSAVSDSNGKALFESCELGAYLLYSAENTFSPFIAFVPMVSEDGSNFNVKAEPKIDISEETTTPEEETETTTKSSSSIIDKEHGGKLPQTGMVQLPIPILGILGAVMFSGGFVLYAKGKKEEE